MLIYDEIYKDILLISIDNLYELLHVRQFFSFNADGRTPLKNIDLVDIMADKIYAGFAPGFFPSRFWLVWWMDLEVFHNSSQLKCQSRFLSLGFHLYDVGYINMIYSDVGYIYMIYIYTL